MQDILQIAKEKLVKLDMLEVKQWFELVENTDASEATVTAVVE